MPGFAPSSAASSFRPPARRRSGRGCSRRSIHSTTIPSGSRAGISSRGLACRGRRSSRSRKSARPSPEGHIDLDAVAAMEADQAHAALTALHGIGPWTADIYLLFCLGNADAWPAGDLALAGGGAPRLRPEEAAGCQGHGEARRSMAAVARGGRASVVGLLSCGEAARGRAGASHLARGDKESRKRTERRMAGELDGPRLEPQSGQPAKRLVVFLHGYGADGNDLIDIGRAWQGLLPDTAFVSPHAPEPCGQAPVGTAVVSALYAARRTSAGTASTRPAPGWSTSSTPSSRAGSCRRRRWRWSASARAP